MISVEQLRAVLPPIYDRPFEVGFSSVRVAIDLEWEEDHPEVLKLIGVGTRDAIAQLWWQDMSPEQRDDARSWIAELIRRRPVVYHNAVGDIQVMRLHGFLVAFEPHYELNDTMQAHSVLHSEEENTLAYLRTKYGKLPECEHLHHQRDRESMAVHNAVSLVDTLYCWEGLEREFVMDPAAENIYRTQNLPLLPIVLEAQEVGCRVDKAKVYPLRDRCVTRIAQALKVAQAYVGYPLNLGSPDQMKEYLYNIERMPVQYAKAARGEEPTPTTDADAISVLRAMFLEFDGEWEEKNDITLDYVMERIERGAHPVLEARVMFAGERQTLGHYINPCLIFEGDPKKGKVVGIRDRLYPQIKVHAQASGRHSITDPPMQQLKGELTELPCPDEGTVWIGFDLDQAELRVDAVLTNDEPSIEAFVKGWDIHTMNCCDIFGLPYPPTLVDPFKDPINLAWVTEWRFTEGKDDLRRVFAKRFVYRLDYGGQAENAGDIPGAKTLQLTSDKLVRASENYLNAHPAKRAWRAETEENAEKYRISYTFMGRPRRLTGKYRGQRIRAAYNHPHQGAVADINNHIILRIKAALPYAVYKWGAHDSQWWAVPVEKTVEAYLTMKEILAQPWSVYGRELKIPATFKEIRHAPFVVVPQAA